MPNYETRYLSHSMACAALSMTLYALSEIRLESDPEAMKRWAERAIKEYTEMSSKKVEAQ